MLKREKEVIQYQLDNEKEVIAALEREYEKALWHINQRIRMYQADEQTLSRIHHINYQKELRRQVEAILERLHSGEYETINQYLTDTYTDAFVGTMYSLAGQGVPVIAPLDRNAMVKAVLTDSKISEGLYNSLGVDTKKLKKAISSEISRGLSSGMAYADIARNIATVTGAPKSRAKAIVRTEGHRIQQASTQDAAMASKARGADVKKQWDSTLDGGTRDTHRRLDGQIREVEEPFSMDGKEAMHPGDFGDPAEDCECRCVELIRATKALDASELERLKERAKFFELDKTKDFEDFKKKYLKAAETVEKSGKSGIIEPGGVLDKFDRKAQSTGLEPDLKASNPKYGSGTGYTQNCQRCVPAYELRRRGYNVQAKPAIVTPTGKLSSKDPIIQGSKWMNGIFGNIQWKKVWTGNGLSDIENAMAGWGDGARAEVYVNWKNGGAHVFIAEQVNGQTRFLDPQSGAPDYRSKFASVKSGYTMFARIDNLSVLDAIEECVENVR